MVIVEAFPRQLSFDMLPWLLCFAVIVQLYVLG